MQYPQLNLLTIKAHYTHRSTARPQALVSSTAKHARCHRQYLLKLKVASQTDIDSISLHDFM